MDWVLHPAFHYGSLALGLAISLYLGVSLLLEVRSLERRSRQRNATLEKDVEDVKASVEMLQFEFGELEQRLNTLPSSQTHGNVSGMNLSKRSQALRMHRRGETPAQIAAALGVATKEIELLLKVHKLVLENY
jgi:hypothetical protein